MVSFTASMAVAADARAVLSRSAPSTNGRLSISCAGTNAEFGKSARSMSSTCSPGASVSDETGVCEARSSSSSAMWPSVRTFSAVSTTLSCSGIVSREQLCSSNHALHGGVLGSGGCSSGGSTSAACTAAPAAAPPSQASPLSRCTERITSSSSISGVADGALRLLESFDGERPCGASEAAFLSRRVDRRRHLHAGRVAWVAHHPAVAWPTQAVVPQPQHRHLSHHMHFEQIRRVVHVEETDHPRSLLSGLRRTQC
eukprot:3567348-Pleurochrysis_carterae.AAC.1